jgi:acyl-coenzyme A synthetase/AMP-(fatty) acid ligase
MWNWYVSALAVGSSIVCYDGSPLVPHINVLWDLVDKLKLEVNCTCLFIAYQRVKHFCISFLVTMLVN